MARVGDNTFPIPDDATGLLSTVARWPSVQNEAGQEVVDLTEIINKQLLHYVLPGTRHLLSHSDVQSLNWKTLCALYEQFDILLISPLPSVHQVFSDFLLRFDRSKLKQAEMDITLRDGSKVLAYWYWPDGFRFWDGKWTRLDPKTMTQILCIEDDLIEANVISRNLSDDATKDVKFPLRVGPFHGLCLRNDVIDAERRTQGTFGPQLELYDATEYRTRPRQRQHRDSMWGLGVSGSGTKIL